MSSSSSSDWRQNANNISRGSLDHIPNSPISSRGRNSSNIKRNFTFSRKSQLGSNVGIQRAKWNGWIQDINQNKSPDIIAKEIIDMQLTFPNASISKLDCGAMVHMLTQLDKQQTDETKNAKPVLELITYFSQKKHLDFSSFELEETLRYLIEKVTTSSRDAELCFDVLQALSYILFSHGGRSSSVQDLLLDTLIVTILEPTNPCDIKCRIMCMGCIGNMLQRKAVNDAFTKRLFQISLKEIETSMHALEVSNSDKLDVTLPKVVQETKLLSSSLRVIHGIAYALGSKFFQKTEISIVMPKLNLLVCFGWNPHVRQPRDTSATPSTPQRKSRSVSDVEASESESEMKYNTVSQFQKQSEKVRIAALEIIQSFCMIDPKSMQAFWTLLLPNKSGCDPNAKPSSIFSVILFDSQSRARAQGLIALTALIERYPIRITLSQRRGAKTKQAFNSLSDKIAKIVDEIHEVLALMLQIEQNPTALKAGLTAVATMLKLVPYESKEYYALLEKLLTKNILIDRAFPRVKAMKPDPVVDLAESCIEAILSSKCSYEAILTEWIELELLPRLAPENDLNPHSLRVLRVYSKLFLWYSAILVKSNIWERIFPLLQMTFASPEATLRLQAIQFVEEMAKADRTNEDQSVIRPWLQSLLVFVLRALQDPESGVRTVAASAISELRFEVWQGITDHERVECVEIVVRAIALRGFGAYEEVQLACLTALGSMALLPSFKTKSFVDTCLPTVLAAMKSESVAIRTKVAIFIANLMSDHFAEDALPFVDVTLRNMLAQTCIIGIDDHEKVSSSLLRASGYIIAYNTESYVDEKQERQLKMILQKWCANPSASAKSRWSACNSIAYVLNHTDRCGMFWPDSGLVEALLSTAVTCDNFKVKLAAVACFLPMNVFPLGAHSIVLDTLGRVYTELFALSDSHLSSQQLQFKENLGNDLATVLIRILELDSNHILHPTDLLLLLLQDEHGHLMRDRGATMESA